jgi:hypothetical protein
LKIKLTKTAVVLVIILFISILLNVSYWHKNKKYENYLSQEAIAIKLKPMGSSIIYAEESLKNIIQNKAITVEELNQLYSWYRIFAFGMQDLQYLYSKVKNTKYTFYSLQPGHFKIYFELDTLQKRINDIKETKHVLTSSELGFMTMMLDYTSLYADVFQDDYMEWNYDIANKKWTEVLKQLDKISSGHF